MIDRTKALKKVMYKLLVLTATIAGMNIAYYVSENITFECLMAIVLLSLEVIYHEKLLKWYAKAVNKFTNTYPTVFKWLVLGFQVCLLCALLVILANALAVGGMFVITLCVVLLLF
jgi:hypothetical protein